MSTVYCDEQVIEIDSTSRSFSNNVKLNNLSTRTVVTAVLAVYRTSIFFTNIVFSVFFKINIQRFTVSLVIKRT